VSACLRALHASTRAKVYTKMTFVVNVSLMHLLGADWKNNKLGCKG